MRLGHARSHSREQTKNSLHFISSAPPPPTPPPRSGKGKEFLVCVAAIIVLYSTIVLQDNESLYLGCSMKNESAIRLGETIKCIRKQKKMSQGDICRAVGFDRAYMSNLEAGKGNPTLLTIEKIARALGVSTDLLLK